jgi:hypothetical protein
MKNYNLIYRYFVQRKQFRVHFVKNLIQLFKLKLVCKLTVVYVGHHSGTVTGIGWVTQGVKTRRFLYESRSRTISQEQFTDRQTRYVVRDHVLCGVGAYRLLPRVATLP